jgi:aminopeptidase C
MTISFDSFNELEAHQKFKQSNIPSRYNLDQIDTILKSKYHAEEVNVKLFLPHLKNDYAFNQSYLTKCYAIQDPSILKNLFNEEEKLENAEFVKKHGVFHTKIDHSNLENSLQAVDQGRVLYIFFQSEDGKYINQFMSQNGCCDRIFFELIVFRGIDPKDCVLGNQEYKVNLIALVEAGYIRI